MVLEPTGGGYIEVTWTDGTTQTYNVPDTHLGSFSHTGNQVKFNAYPVGETSGLISPVVLNFDNMRGYVKHGFPE